MRPSSLIFFTTLALTLASRVSIAAEKTPSLCPMFEGHVIGTKGGRPVVATCLFITRVQFAIDKAVTRSPFRPLVDTVMNIGGQSFEEFLTEPNNQEFRERCKPDSNLKAGEAGTFTCLTFGVPFRFVVDARHRVIKLDIIIDSNEAFGSRLLPLLQERLASSSSAYLNKPNQEYIFLVWQAEAARFNQLALPGEIYRVEKHSFMIDVRNPFSTH